MNLCSLHNDGKIEWNGMGILAFSKQNDRQIQRSSNRIVSDLSVPMRYFYQCHGNLHIVIRIQKIKIIKLRIAACVRRLWCKRKIFLTTKKTDPFSAIGYTWRFPIFLCFESSIIGLYNASNLSSTTKENIELLERRRAYNQSISDETFPVYKYSIIHRIQCKVDVYW